MKKEIKTIGTIRITARRTVNGSDDDRSSRCPDDDLVGTDSLPSPGEDQVEHQKLNQRTAPLPRTIFDYLLP